MHKALQLKQFIVKSKLTWENKFLSLIVYHTVSNGELKQMVIVRTFQT